VMSRRPYGAFLRPHSDVMDGWFCACIHLDGDELGRYPVVDGASASKRKRTAEKSASEHAVHDSLLVREPSSGDMAPESAVWRNYGDSILPHYRPTHVASSMISVT
jgi:hypothetical protein